MARPRRGDLVPLDVEDLAFGGDGVGRLGGYVVFVRGGIPGDRLRVRIVEARARHGRGVIDAIEAPSPDRVEAPCPHFGPCGGCRLQQMAYPAQLAFKQKQVKDCLERLGGLGDVDVRPILAAPDAFGYRNKMEFTVVGGAAPLIGLHEADRYDAVRDIDRCLLQSDAMNALLAEVRSAVGEAGIAAWDPGTDEGLLRFVALREGRRTGEEMVNFVAARPEVERLTPLAERVRTRVPGTASVVLNVTDRRSSVAVGTAEHVLAGRRRVTERLGGLEFTVSANSFFQTNTLQAERLFELVVAACALEGGETVVDLYSGTGAISLLLARRAGRVYGIELAPSAVEDAERNAAANGITSCTFLLGEVRHVLPALVRDGIRAAVVVADPPRAGLHPKALQALVALAPPLVVYASCNPSTLARDLAGLVRAGYRVEWVQPVDMFPQTAHIEAVARVVRDR